MSDSDREKKESKEIGFFYNFFFIKILTSYCFNKKADRSESSRSQGPDY